MVVLVESLVGASSAMSAFRGECAGGKAFMKWLNWFYEMAVATSKKRRRKSPVLGSTGKIVL